MAEGSLIGWLDQPGFKPWTLNPGIGCTPRSTGCNTCYAPRSAIRQAHYEGRGGIVTKDPLGRTVWTGKVITFPERLERPAATKTPHMIFVNALMELFDPQVSIEFIDAVWQMMAATPWHIYVIFSKLSKRMHDIVTRMVAKHGVLPNVWLGASVENQRYAQIRLPWLLRTPAAIRIGSFEPLLGPVDPTRIHAGSRQQPDMVYDVLGRRYGVPGAWQAPMSAGLDWVIVGGESGRRADVRPMHPQWARDLRDHAVATGVAFFFKQWGSWGPAPWQVPLFDPATGWQGTEEELAAAKRAAEKVGATHAYPVWADRYNWMITEAAGKPWSTERAALAAGEHHAPLRFYPGKSAGYELDGQVWQQWPSVDGRIIEAPRRELVSSV